MARQPDVQYIRLYTDGSAARKLELVSPVRKAKTPRARKQKKIVVHVDPVAIFGILTAFVMLIVMASSYYNLNQAQESAAAMESYVQELRQENASLWEQYETGYDLEEVERTALALGMVPSEQVEHVAVQVTVPEVKPTPNGWERLCTFLAGLFA